MFRFVISDTSTVASSSQRRLKHETHCIGYRSHRADVSDRSGGRFTDQWLAGAGTATSNDVEPDHKYFNCCGDTDRAWSEIDHHY